VGLRERNFELETLPGVGALDAHLLAVGVEQTNVAARAEGDGPHVTPQVGLEQPLAGRHDRRGAHGQPRDQLRLGGGDRLD
jgi:hypothetical protein